MLFFNFTVHSNVSILRGSVLSAPFDFRVTVQSKVCILGGILGAPFHLRLVVCRNVRVQGWSVFGSLGGMEGDYLLLVLVDIV